MSEIESELEKEMLVVRKTEIAYQVACDKLETLLGWCDKMYRIINGRKQDDNADKRYTSGGNNAPREYAG